MAVISTSGTEKIKKSAKITKTSRVLSVYHLFRNCQEVSFQELEQQLGMGRRTAYRDIRLLRQAGALDARYDRTLGAFVPVSLEPFPMEKQENQTRQKYLEKIRRLCALMERMSWEDGYDAVNPVSKTDLYREIFPGASDRTRQRDFQELDKLGYRAYYEKGWEDEPGRWYYEIPDAYGLETFRL